MDTQTSVKVGEAIAKAWSDDAYRARLIDSPNEAFREMGITMPDGTGIRVVEQADGGDGNGSLFSKDGDGLVLALPPAPDGFDGKVGDELLEAVAGGGGCLDPWPRKSIDLPAP